MQKKRKKQKDDRVSVKELIQLVRELVLLLTAIVALILLLLKGK